jgi:hypothetical protein
MKLRTSPDLYTRSENTTRRKLEDDPNNEYAIWMLNQYKELREQDHELIFNSKKQEDNLEFDLRTTDWIIEKVQANKVYAQNLYAAICNREFMKNDVFPILKEKFWSCTWRYAAGIVANMCEKGDYLDWYASNAKEHNDYYVSEGEVTDEIKEDLFKLGWLVLDER